MIDAPAELVAARISLQPLDSLTTSYSPYTFVGESLDFGGASWDLNVEVPPLDYDKAAVIHAWADRLRVKGAFARIAAPARLRRLGTSTATFVTATAPALAGASSFPVTGVGVDRTLLAGTFVSVNNRLHKVTQNVIGNSGTLHIFPHLRDAIPNGQAVQVSVPYGLWTLLARPSLDLSAGSQPRKAEAFTLRFRHV